MKTANVQINLVDNTKSIATPVNGVLFAIGKTEAGPINDPKDIITSWTQFKENFGGLSQTSLFPLHCRHLLEAGVKLRIARVAHYSDIEDASTLSATPNKTNQVKYLVFDSALVASNSIALSVNSSAITAVTYATSHSNTLDLLAAAIQLKLGALGSANCMGKVEVMDPVDVAAMSYWNGQAVTNFGVANTTFGRVIKITPYNNSAIAITAISITGGASQPVLTYVNTATCDVYSYGKEKLFTIEGKEPGISYDSLVVTISSMGSTIDSSGSITIQVVGSKGDISISESSTVTLHGNIFVTTGGVYKTDMAHAYDFWAALNAGLNKIKIIPATVCDGSVESTFSFPPIPQLGTYELSGASIGGAIVIADYTGSILSGTGLHAFDDYTDSYAVFAPELPDDTDATLKTWAEALIQYAESRQDLRGYVHLPNYTDPQDVIDYKLSIEGNGSSMITFLYGGYKLKDVSTGVIYETTPVSAVLAAMIKVQQRFGEWRSFAGPTYGVLPFGSGVVNNWGSPAKQAYRELLAQDGINCVIARGTTLILWDDYTGNNNPTQLQFSSIVNMVIYLRKVLAPNSEKYYSEPLDLRLFQTIFYDCKPIMDAMVTGRALFSYEWKGDQGAASIDDLQINNKSDIQAGKYKVALDLTSISPLKQFTIDLILQKA